MTDYGIDPTKTRFATEGVTKVYTFWRELAAGRKMPLKSEFDPLEIAPFLPGILLVEVEGIRPDGSGLYRYKVVGQMEVAARGHNPTGKLVDEGFHAESREAAIGDYDFVREFGEPHYAPIEFINEKGVPVSEDSILLPFANEEGKVGHILVYSERTG